MTPAAAVRGYVLESVERIRSIPGEQWRGELGYLAAISPTVHRLALEMIERQAVAFADAVLAPTEVAPEIARLEGIALAAVFQTIISEAGNRTREGRSQAKIADELQRLPVTRVEEILTSRHEREEVLGPIRRFLVCGHQVALSASRSSLASGPHRRSAER